MRYWMIEGRKGGREGRKVERRSLITSWMRLLSSSPAPLALPQRFEREASRTFHLHKARMVHEASVTQAFFPSTPPPAYLHHRYPGVVFEHESMRDGQRLAL